MDILETLKGGDLRSIGNADKVSRVIAKDAHGFDRVFKAIFTDDPLLRMRAADSIEKVSRSNPVLLQKYKKKLLNSLETFDQQEVRWHVAQMISYIKLNIQEAHFVAKILTNWIKTDKSHIVKVNSMQAIWDISNSIPEIKPQAIKLINEQMESGIPSIVSRGKKLLNGFNK